MRAESACRSIKNEATDEITQQLVREVEGRRSRRALAVIPEFRSRARDPASTRQRNSTNWRSSGTRNGLSFQPLH